MIQIQMDLTSYAVDVIVSTVAVILLSIQHHLLFRVQSVLTVTVVYTPQFASAGYLWYFNLFQRKTQQN